MLYLHWRKISLISSLVALLAFSPTLHAQHSSDNINYFAFSKRPYYFGLRIASIYSDFQINPSKNFIGGDYTTIKSITGSGAGASVVFNLKVGKFFDLRLLPTVSYQSRDFIFTSPSQGETTDRIESIFLEMPILVRYKSKAYKDKKAFLVGGVKYAYDVQSNSKLDQKRFNDILRTSPHDFSLEIGAGIQFFFPYFIFSPEIKFSQGIDNMLIYNKNLPRAKVIESILSRSISISVHFEG